jgi:hypothetical protein
MVSIEEQRLAFTFSLRSRTLVRDDDVLEKIFTRTIYRKFGKEITLW